MQSALLRTARFSASAKGQNIVTPKTESPSAWSPHPPLQPGAAFAAGGSSAVTHPPWLALKNQVVQIPGRALRLLRCDRPYCIVIHGSFLRVYISSGPGLFCRHTDYYMRDNHGYVPNFVHRWESFLKCGGTEALKSKHQAS